MKPRNEEAQAHIGLSSHRKKNITYNHLGFLALNYYFACFIYPTLRDEHSLRVSENRVLRKISGRERYEATGDCIMRSFMILPHGIFLG
jgi:hypothetical protein